MEIILAQERIFQLTPQVPFDQARARAEEKKASLIAGMLGSLFSRPKPEEIPLVGVQYRWEPYWAIGVHLRTVYDRQRQYNVVVGGPEVRQVTVLGTDLPVENVAKAGPAFTVTGVEHCEEDFRALRIFSGAGAAASDANGITEMPQTEVADLATLQGDGVVVVAPEMSANAVIRQVVAETVKPVKAQVIHEETLMLERIDLFFRPVYALEYHWAAKGKQAVILCDAMSGEIKLGGPGLKDHLKTMLNRDLLFDLSADAIGMVVPGGSIAVKLTKAVIDRKRP